MQYHRRADIFTRLPCGRQRENWALGTIRPRAFLRRFCVHCGFRRLVSACFTRHRGERQDKSSARKRRGICLGQAAGREAGWRRVALARFKLCWKSPCAFIDHARSSSSFCGIAFAQNNSPSAHRVVPVNGTKTSYALPRGATSFVIRLKDRPEARSFVFVNENAAAEGELSIAVSKQSLAADSPQWSAVEGTVRFRKKRLFTVSLVGVEANYVRLNFRVEVPRHKWRQKPPAIGRAAYKLARIASS